METINIPPERARSLFLYLDGLRFACALCTVNLERAMASLRALEKYAQEGAGAPTHLVLLVVADLWGVVDSAFRARLLAARTPYLKRVSSEYQIFERQTRMVDTMRHYIQHLDERISSRAEIFTPVWGFISWQSAREPSTAFTLIAGTPTVTQNHYSLTWDRLESKFVRELELIVGDSTFDVAGTVKSVERLNKQIKEWCKTFSFEGGKYLYDPEAVPIFKFSVPDKT